MQRSVLKKHSKKDSTSIILNMALLKTHGGRRSLGDYLIIVGWILKINHLEMNQRKNSLKMINLNKRNRRKRKRFRKKLQLCINLINAP